MIRNIFTDQATNGSSAAYEHGGGHIAILVWGTFGAGVVTIEILAPDGTWVMIDGGAWSEKLCRSMQLPPCRIRATLANATAPSVSCAFITY